MRAATLRRRDAARLRVADQAAAAGAEAAPELEADLRQLRGLARAGLAADDHDLVRRDRARDLVAPAGDRQRFGERDRRNRIRFDDARNARRPRLATRLPVLRIACLRRFLRGRTAC